MNTRISPITAALLLCGSSFTTAGTWTQLKTQPTFLNPPADCKTYKNANCSPTIAFGGVANVNLMTDGRLLAVALAVDNNLHYKWVNYTLTPDVHGSYVNGTWKLVAPLPNAASSTNPNGWGPYYMDSAILPDGRVIIEGGEFDGFLYNNYGHSYRWFRESGNGAVYDPVANKWMAIKPPSFFNNLYPANPPNRPGNVGFLYPVSPPPEKTSTFVHPIGATASIVLPNGEFMVSDPLSKQNAILDAKTLTWRSTGVGKADVNALEGWTLLPSGKVMTIDCYADYWFGLIPTYPSGGQNVELYDPKTGKWSSVGKTNIPLTSYPVSRIGAAVLMADGRVLAMGSTNKTAIYNPTTNKWSAGPTFPTIVFKHQNLNLSAYSSAATLLPNGNVLITTQGNLAHVNPAWDSPQPPLTFFEYDGTKLIKEPNVTYSALDVIGSLLPLPSGQVLFWDGQTDLEIYTPSTSVDTKRPSYAPVISSAPSIVKPGGSYTLKGILFNGVSQGGFLGLVQQATNYPLVRITNTKTGHVFYSRSYKFSSMAVASRAPVTTNFTVPKNQELGPSTLEVVTNGKPSLPHKITVEN